TPTPGEPRRGSTGRLASFSSTMVSTTIMEAGLLPCALDHDAGTLTKSLLPRKLADRETARATSTGPKCPRSLRIPSGARAAQWISVDIEFRGNAIRSCFWL